MAVIMVVIMVKPHAIHIVRAIRVVHAIRIVRATRVKRLPATRALR